MKHADVKYWPLQGSLLVFFLLVIPEGRKKRPSRKNPKQIKQVALGGPDRLVGPVD